jgi:uncharacterized membrane protein YkvA (DUF1232 family)
MNIMAGFNFSKIQNIWMTKGAKLLTNNRKMGVYLNAATFLLSKDASFFKEVRDDIKTSVRLLKSYVNGSYKEIAWRSVVSLSAGMVYLVSPIDAIPDFIPIQGFLDDFAVLIIIFKQLDMDLKNFKEWESSLDKSQE